MKTVVEKLNVQKSPGLESVPFKQEHNAESFELLSSDIYTKPILAIIRELSANAVDAHVMAKNTQTPFVIHTPTILEPFWQIRDYGTGISPENINNVYTVYFKSDKRDNNDTTGEKGLGSKTPFAYTDNFTVHNYYNGVKYTYNAFKDDDGLPRLAPVSQEPTTEHSGLEVKFPVNRDDHGQFKNYIQIALRFFKFKPIIKGVANFKFDKEPEYLIRTPEFGILAEKSGESFVVMGNIGYPIDQQPFDKTVHVLDSREKKLLDYGIHLFVPIGSPVKTQASREALNYTPNTRVFVKKILGKAVEVVEAEANKKLTEAKTMWDARVLFGQVRTGIIGEICDLKNNNFINWKGKSISDVISLKDYAVRPVAVEILSIEKDEVDQWGYKRRRYRNSNEPKVINCGNGLRRWPTTAFEAATTKAIFVNDLERGGYVGAARYMELHGIKKAVMLSDAPDEFIKAVGCEKLVILCSSLPKPERKKREYVKYGSRERTLIQRVDGYNLRNCEVDMSAGGIYVEVRRDKVKWYPIYSQAAKANTAHTFSFYHLQDAYIPGMYGTTISDIIEHVKVFGYALDEPVYAIRPCDKAKMEKYEDRWTSLHDCLSDILSTYSALLPEARLAETVSSLNKNILLFSKLNLAHDSIARETIDLIQSCEKAALNNMVLSFRKLNAYVKMYEITPVNDVVKQQELFLKTYKLLNHVNHWANTDIHSEIEAYINMVDQQNRKAKVAVA